MSTQDKAFITGTMHMLCICAMINNLIIDLSVFPEYSSPVMHTVYIHIFILLIYIYRLFSHTVYGYL